MQQPTQFKTVEDNVNEQHPNPVVPSADSTTAGDHSPPKIVGIKPSVAVANIRASIWRVMHKRIKIE